jgi:hypothetical protein
MPDLATLLDDEYVPVGGAANSLARRLPGSTVSFDDRGIHQQRQRWTRWRNALPRTA